MVDNPRKRKMHECPTCGQCFRSPCELEEHRRGHTGGRPYICAACGQTFAKRFCLNRHALTHSAERPHRCTECPRAFIQRNDLEAHMRVHSGERPHVCLTCGAAFSQPSHLTQHGRIHTGEKPFKCPTCSQAFATRFTLTNHLRVHTGEKPYACDTCNEAFATHGSLISHGRTHSGEKPYGCVVCGHAFAQQSALKRHLAALHTIRGQQRQKRKEERVARFLDSTGFRYDRELTIQFCGEGNKKSARLDFVIYRDYGVCILEVDEDQHKHYPVECETARMMDIFAEQVKAGRLDNIKVVRFNPDAFRESGKLTRVPMKERHEKLLQVIMAAPTNHFSITYLYYDQSSPYPDVCLDPAYPRELRDLVEHG